MRRLRRFGLLLLVAAGAGALIYILLRQQHDALPDLPPFTLEQRPQADRLLFDYAGLLEHYREGTRNYLHGITQQFHIEAVIVSLPDLGPARNIEELAVDIANRWQIGREHEGRGLLLLLVNDGKQVKLEVAYELEDVFTDAFSGYVEDLQLKPYFLRDDLGTGLIAVMEELEQRAQLKRQDDYTPGMISQLDAELLAGGAGAKRQLNRYRDTQPSAETSRYDPADGARSPADAWRIMLAKWAGKGADIQADIYTEMTKLAMGDQNRPDDRTRAALPQWQDAEFQVLGDEDHAVIFFGNRKGWNNAPFLFCNTPAGWKFDIVHQRRLVVMGSNPDWKVEQGNYPYVNLLDQVPQSTGKDLPLEPSDLYACSRDEQIAREMRTLQQRLETSPDDFDTVMALARLNVISGRRPNHVTPLIKRAKQLDPASALPYKYAAIYNVNSFFQYETALQDIETYIEKEPGDAFGYNVKGFLHYRLGNYRKSIEALEQTLELDADNVYACALMSRDYALLYSKAYKLDPRRANYRKQALAMLHQAETAGTQDAARIDRLKHWLQRRKIL
ncbi:MAG: TPM domain-containing protein [Gammaproteobacteria bacterium]|jgi:tetratricopeptide (TPR) repeat protein